MIGGAASFGPDLPYPPNPDYGSGATRRRIELQGLPGRVDAWLADNFHEMTCILLHDGWVVTGIEGSMIRIPTTAYPGAIAVLQELVGRPIESSGADLFAGGRSRRNCTHLFELATFALAHARRGNIDRVYEAIVPDEKNGLAMAEVSRDGRTVHRWSISGGAITAPANLAGKPTGKGFASWAHTTFGGEELEAAIMLARLHYLSIGRRWLTEVFTGEPITRNAELAGVCHAYPPSRRAGANRRHPLGCNHHERLGIGGDRAALQPGE